MKLWSFSTTLRNPERMNSFLKVLCLLEGEPFNTDTQIKYQILLIQYKIYKPNAIPTELLEKVNDPIVSEITYSEAEEIFYHQDYEDPPMRGRTSASPLFKMCLAKLEGDRRVIKITQMGHQFLNDEDNPVYITRFLTKLKFPNTLWADFSKTNGFSIKPFVESLRFILEAEDKYGNGLTFDEFSLFIPTLINPKQYEVNKRFLDKYRKSQKKENVIKEFACYFYKVYNPKNEQIKNFYEYGDNILRYFRMTKLISCSRSSLYNQRISIEPTRKTEAISIINNFSKPYDGDLDYIDYLSDLTVPQFEWEIDINAKRKSCYDIYEEIGKLISEEDLIEEEDSNKYNTYKDLTSFTISELDDVKADIRDMLTRILKRKHKKMMTTDLEYVQELLSDLTTSKTINKMKPEILEQYIYKLLLFLNDELNIIPNYKPDDNGDPISHAPGNKPDIECFYQVFNSICEVTKVNSNRQWISEAQPVMRHLEQFKTKYYSKESYCLFIAPNIHEDTAFYFYTSIVIGYSNTILKMVPISVPQFKDIIDFYLSFIRNHGRRIPSIFLKELFDRIVDSAHNTAGHKLWLHGIQARIDTWKESIINDYK